MRIFSPFGAALLALLLAGCALQPGQPAATAPSAAQPVASPASQAADAPAGSLTVYSGRIEKLVGPAMEQFKKQTGVDVKVRYGETAELAATIMEEGKNSPADVFFAQDAGALGALATADRFSKLSESILDRVEPRFRSSRGDWVGVSGRARVVVYNTGALKPEDLPDSILGFTHAKWKGTIGWPPTNGSFQAFVTALRMTEGDEGARRWLEGIKANSPKAYSNNTAIVQAVGGGEIQVGLVNHYYLFQFLTQQGESFPARNYHPRAGGPGAMINVAGVGILSTTKNARAAERLVDHLLTKETQQYFADETLEYPLIRGVKTHPMLVPLEQIKTPNIDLGNLADLEKSLKLLRDAGIL